MRRTTLHPGSGIEFDLRLARWLSRRTTTRPAAISTGIFGADGANHTYGRLTGVGRRHTLGGARARVRHRQGDAPRQGRWRTLVNFAGWRGREYRAGGGQEWSHKE